MDKETAATPVKIQKLTHFHQEIPLPQGSTTVPYKPQHTSTSKKSKKTKKRFDEFAYYRFAEDKNKIMKVLFKDEESYMVMGYYPFTEPKDDIEKVSTISERNLLKVIKAEAAYIGHVGDEIVVKKMNQVKLGEDGNQFDTIGDNFEIMKIQNKQRFEQFLRILKNHEKAMQISIRVIIDESVINEPVIIDYEFFKRETQVKNTNLKFIHGK